MTRTVADAAIMFQAIAGYDPAESTSRELRVPDYAAGVREKVSTIRVGVARGFFFDDLDPELEVAVSEALRVMQQVRGF